MASDHHRDMGDPVNGAKTYLTLIDVISKSLRPLGNGKALGCCRCYTASSLACQLIKRHSGVLGSAVIKKRSGGREVIQWPDFPHGDAMSSLYFTRSYLEVLVDFDERLLKWHWKHLSVIFEESMSWTPLDFIKNAKFCTAVPMADYLNRQLKNPRPPVVDGVKPYFRGPLKRYLTNRINTGRGRNLRLAWSILQGVKRGCAPASEEYLQSEYRSYADLLREPPSNPYSDYTRYYSEIWSGLRVVRETQKFYPSKSAKLGFNRSIGGGVQGMVKTMDLDSGLIDMVDTDKGIVERHGVSIPPLSDLLASESEEPCTVRVQGLLEPLKVRFITKSPSVRSYVCKPIQNALWTHLKDSEPFALIGHPIRREDLQRLKIKSSRFDFGSRPFWVSGDYKSATDRIDLRQTKDALECALAELLLHDQIGLRQADACRRELYEQTITFPEHLKMADVQQNNGQLMGSILSFPILCVINLAAYWSSMEEYFQREFSLHDLPVLINGDDIGFMSNAEHYAIWQQKIHEVGLKLSIGKNYIHPTYFTINSELWNMRDLTQVNFFNLGCFTNMNRRTGRESTKSLPLGELWSEVHAGACDKKRAWRRFVHYNKEQIQTATLNGKLNLGLPYTAGGLSCSIPCDYKVTDGQKRLQRYCEQVYRNEGRTLTGVKGKSHMLHKHARPYLMRLYEGTYEVILSSNFGYLDRRIPVELLDSPEEELILPVKIPIESHMSPFGPILALDEVENKFSYPSKKDFNQARTFQPGGNPKNFCLTKKVPMDKRFVMGKVIKVTPY
jgi:hypothetical protein